MQRSSRWFAIAGLALTLGCGNGAPRPEKTPDEKSPEVGSAAARPPVTDALVQVVIYGLAAFKLKHDGQGKLIELSAHFPRESSAPHYLGLDRGVYDSGVRKWEEVIKDDHGDDIDLAKSTIRIQMNGYNDLLEDLQVPNTSFVDYPASTDEAADARWMLRTQEFDSLATDFDPKDATVHAEFAKGSLETCALVFPADNSNAVCKAQINGKTRSASEIMVIRGLVPLSASKVEVTIDGSSLQTTTVKPMGGPSVPVTWKGNTYTTVINIAIRNIDKVKRTMVTGHANHLKDFFPGAASSNWDIDIPDCKYDAQHSVWDCSKCMKDLQPDCWTYFLELFKNTPGGYDRPICPFVGWNP